MIKQKFTFTNLIILLFLKKLNNKIQLIKEITVTVQNTVKELKNFEFKCKDIMFCTNAFTTKFLPECKVAPGRG